MGKIMCKAVDNVYYDVPGPYPKSIPVFGWDAASFNINAVEVDGIQPTIFNQTSKICTGPKEVGDWIPQDVSIDTGVYVNWNESFSITTEFRFDQQQGRRLIIGNYKDDAAGNGDLCIEIDADDNLRLAIDQRAIDERYDVLGEDGTYHILTYNYNHKSGRHTLSGTNTRVGSTWTKEVVYKMYNQALTPLRIGNNDNRTESPFSNITIRYPKINRYTYITDVTATLIKGLYMKSQSTVEGKPLLYTNKYNHLYYGFAVGKGGKQGSNGQFLLDKRTGGGGGGAGTVLFWVSAAPGTAYGDGGVHVSTWNDGSKYEVWFTAGQYRIKFRAMAGYDGRNGSSSATASSSGNGPGGVAGYDSGGGSGGYGHADILLSNDGGNSYWEHATSLVNNTASNKDVVFTHGPLHVVARLQCGTAGGPGDNDGYTGHTAAANSWSMSQNIKNALGIKGLYNVAWSRSDGRNGASIAPGIKTSADGTITWYGSGGENPQSGAAMYWNYNPL